MAIRKRKTQANYIKVNETFELIEGDAIVIIDRMTGTYSITIEFEENIGYKNIWILTQLFYRIATEPQVLISADQGE